MFKKQLLFIATLLLANTAVNAQTSVNVAVNAGTTVRTVDERIFGVNSVMWDQAVSLEYSPSNLTQTIQAVQDAGIRFIRLPGGSNSDIYHWYENKSFDQPWHWASGFNSSSNLVRNAQTQAIVTVNYGTGTPEEAAAWVAYANFSTAATNVSIGTAAEYANVYRGAGTMDFHDALYWASLRAAAPLSTDDGMNFLRLGLTQPMGFKYWEIGNEVYGASWETDKHTLPNEPYTYATNAALFIRKMKAVDPTIKIGVVVETGQDSYSNGTTHSVSGHNGWTPIVLDTLKKANVTPDFLIYHRYDMAPGQESDSKLLQASSGTTGITSWASDATDLRTQITNYFGSGGSSIELLVTEHNSVYSNPGRQSTSLVNGLFLADSVGNILQTEFNSMNWWALRNGGDSSANNLSSSLYGWRHFGDYGMLSTATTCSNLANCDPTSYDAYPAYYAMKLLSYFARGGDTVIATSSNNSLLAAYGTKRSGDSSLALMVINKSPTATASAQLNVSGFATGSSGIMYTYGMSNDNAANPLLGTGCAGITSTPINPATSISFAPYSINVLTFNRAAEALTTTAPIIVASPVNRSVTAGATTTFSAGASGCPAPSFQWQRQANGASTWTPLTDDSTYTGTATATLTVITAGAMSGDQFRVTATNTTSTVNSTPATLTVSASSSSSSSSISSSSSSSAVVSTGGGGGGGGGSIDWRLLVMLAICVLLSGLLRNYELENAN